MAKPDLGQKHICSNCGAKFYDLTRQPPVCPACGTTVETGERPRPRRAETKAKPKPAPAVVEEEDLDTEIGDDEVDEDFDDEDLEDEDESDEIIEDASELGEDDDDVAVAVGESDEED